MTSAADRKKIRALEENVEELDAKNKKLERLKEKLEKELKETTEKLNETQTKVATDNIAKKTVETVFGKIIYEKTKTKKKKKFIVFKNAFSIVLCGNHKQISNQTNFNEF